MMEFSETRSACDRRAIADRAAVGVEARHKPGEFAGTEISMALRESKYSVQNTMVVARRLRATPRTRGMPGGPVISPATRWNGSAGPWASWSGQFQGPFERGGRGRSGVQNR